MIFKSENYYIGNQNYPESCKNKNNTFYKTAKTKTKKNKKHKKRWKQTAEKKVMSAY